MTKSLGETGHAVARGSTVLVRCQDEGLYDTFVSATRGIRTKLGRGVVDLNHDNSKFIVKPLDFPWASTARTCRSVVDATRDATSLLPGTSPRQWLKGICMMTTPIPLP